MEIIKKIKRFLVWIIGQLFVQIVFSVFILPIIPTWIASQPFIKSKLLEIFKFNEFFFFISVFSTIASFIAFSWAIYLYWKHERYREYFGVSWNRLYKMRCTRCKAPLKNSTHGKHIFFCSGCNEKYVLRTDEGVELSRASATALLKREAIKFFRWQTNNYKKPTFIKRKVKWFSAK